MNINQEMGVSAGGIVVPGARVSCGMKGRFDVEVVAPDGTVKSRTVGHNAVTTEGANNVLDTVFGGSPAASSPWYIGLIDNNLFGTLASADTLASHGGWVEVLPGDIVGDARIEWVDDSAAAGSKTNTTVAQFVFDSAYVVYGAFLCNVATGTSGILHSTAGFSSTQTLGIGDTLRVQYTVTLTI